EHRQLRGVWRHPPSASARDRCRIFDGSSHNCVSYPAYKLIYEFITRTVWRYNQRLKISDSRDLDGIISRFTYPIEHRYYDQNIESSAFSLFAIRSVFAIASFCASNRCRVASRAAWNWRSS